MSLGSGCAKNARAFNAFASVQKAKRDLTRRFPNVSVRWESAPCLSRGRRKISLITSPFVGRSDRGPRSGWGRMFKRATPKDISRSRQLRSNATEAERLLWWKLRELKKLGHHFRRQAPFRSYTLDFVEHNCQIVIELDGGQHNTNEHRAHDQRRDKLLKSQGYSTLRFWNNDVLENLDTVVDTIIAALKKRKHRPPPARGSRPLAPSPQRGR